MTQDMPKLSPLKQALLAIEELQAKLAKSERAGTEPIAIIGMACLFPGGENTTAFWNTLLRGQDAVTEIPKGRWNIDELYDPDPEAWGKIATKWAGLIPNIDQFDPEFFGISPREAHSMDPQQRLLLEVTWHALENAGLTPQSLAAARTGVFVGMTGDEYAEPAYRSANPSSFDAYFASGVARSVASGRISYFLGIQGPNLTIDTACSSSLVAVHNACLHLHLGECSVALAAGVNAVLSPNVTMALSKSHMMASDGRCKTFDSRADGFVRGEGCGVVILKRLRDAQADGNQILAVIRGSAVNQDGRTSGLTVPNGAAQQAVIQQALEAAKVEPRHIQFVEAHGTGTALGDPIEAHALANVLGTNRTQPLVVGSVKTNIGHLEAAAGIAGLIKVVLSLQHNWIPAHLHWHAMNPHIDWRAVPVEIPVNGKAWPRSRERRLAGVSSFGFSGTNAHVILEEAPVAEIAETTQRSWYVLPISAKTEPALHELITAYGERLRDQDIASLCFTAGSGRSHFEERVAVVGRNIQELRDRLATGRFARGTHRRKRPKIAFKFAGELAAAAQRDLRESEPTFRRSIDNGASPLRALAELWKSWGVEPNCTVTLNAVGITPLPRAKHIATSSATQLDATIRDLKQQDYQIVDVCAVAQDGATSLAEAIAGLYASGVDFLWSQLYPRRALIDVPTYPFQRQRYWIEHDAGASLLGQPVRVAGTPEMTVWTGRIGTSTHPFLADHVVQGRPLVPMTMFLELMFQACPGRRLTSLFFQAPLPLPDANPVTIQVVRKDDFLEVYSLRDTATLHAIANISAPCIPNQAADLASVQAEISEPFAAEQFYADAQQRGIFFGPAFRGLQQLSKGDAKGLGRISAPPGLDSAGYHFHPALFDACLQVVGVAANETGCALFMPVAADEVSIHGEVSGSLYSHVTTRDNRPAGTLVCDVKILGEDGHRVAEVRGLVMLPAPVAASALATECLYEERWIPSPLVQPPALNIAGIASKLIGQVSQTLHDHQVDTYPDLKIELDRGCSYAIFNALVSLGLESGITATTPALARQLGIADRYQALLERFLAILVEDQILRRDGERWILDRLPLAPADTFDELARRFPAFANEIGFAKRCTPQLARVLKGETNPLQLLFPNGSTAEAEALYSESASAQAYNSMVRDAVREIAARYKGSVPFRLLEIGAGTGGTTKFLAPVMDPASTEYTFTDLSPAFVARAQERFQAYPFLRYEVLDLEKDPRAQSFSEGHYDLILATNCIHATADLGQSLRNIRKLLSPGGVLILTEITKPERWVDVSFGLTEGWWRFTDRALRPHYPLLSAEEWVETLAAQGFAPAAPVVSPDNGTAILIAVTDILRTGDWLVVADTQGVGDEFASLLAPHVRSCTKAGFDALQPEIWTRDWQGVAILSALDAAPLEDLTSAGMERAQELACRKALEFAQKLRKAPAQFVLVTRGAQSVQIDDALSPAQSTVWGFARSVAEERPDFHSRVVDLDPQESANVCAETLLGEVLSGSSSESAWRKGERYCSQLTHASPTTPLRLSVTTRGSIDNLEFQTVHRKPPAAGQVEIAVTASGVNFRDVLNVLGLYPGDPGPLGGECSGTIVAVGTGVPGWKMGDEVVALAPGAHDGFVLADARLVAHKPRTLSLEEAAGFAISFLTAHYTLHDLGRMKTGDRVLIHAAAGGVGLAAVQLAQRAGAEVFATAGSESKRAYLRSLGVPHVLDSRSTAFAGEIRRITGGRGVDVVLNSLANEFVDASFEITSVGGRFLEIGKRGIWSDAQVSALNKSISYHRVDWGETASRDPDLIGGMFREIMAAAERNEIQALPMRVWNYSDAKQALRFMAQARHIGKIVLRQPGSPLAVRERGLYVIAGGFGALGIESAKWLFAQGGREFVLIGRSKPGDVATREIAALRSAGARVQEVVIDLGAEEALSSAIDWRSVRGVIHSAGHLSDGLLSQLDWAKFREPQQAKADGTVALHRLTADSPLDFFVLYSSIASITGGAGQANHAAANSFEDALALARRAQGLPAISINWGAWSELGAAVRDPELERRRSRMGLKTITVREGFQLLDHILRVNHPHVIAARVDWDTYAAHSRHPAERLSKITKKTRVHSSTTHAPSRESSAGAAGLDSLGSVRERVRQLAGRILGFGAHRHIEPKQPLQELGLDSLMAVEFRNVLAASLGHPLPSTLLFNCPAIEDIAQYVAAEVLRLTPAVPKPGLTEAVPHGLALVNEIEDLSDEEVDRLLAERTVADR